MKITSDYGSKLIWNSSALPWLWKLRLRCEIWYFFSWDVCQRFVNWICKFFTFSRSVKLIRISEEIFNSRLLSISDTLMFSRVLDLLVIVSLGYYEMYSLFNRGKTTNSFLIYLRIKRFTFVFVEPSSAENEVKNLRCHRRYEIIINGNWYLWNRIWIERNCENDWVVGTLNEMIKFSDGIPKREIFHFLILFYIDRHKKRRIYSSLKKVAKAFLLYIYWKTIKIFFASGRRLFSD